MELFMYFIAMIGGSWQYEPWFVVTLLVSITIGSMAIALLMEYAYSRWSQRP